MADFDTREMRLDVGLANEKGWRDLKVVQGEPILGAAPSENAISILSLIHLSDLHICDAQSPARAEIMDRFADPHHPLSTVVKLVGAYRAQEIMTAQGLESMIRTVNLIQNGPVTARAIDAVVVTGDVTDNAQQNELEWYLTLMDGGDVHPDSGDLTAWEGVASTESDKYDRSYWNPEGTPEGLEDDFPRSLYGMPTIPGITDAVRRPFKAMGIRHNWLATHGNHDALLQGTVPPDEALLAFATGNQRVAGLSPQLDLAEAFANWSGVGPASYADPLGGAFSGQEADPKRRFNRASDWANLHLSCGHGHGLTSENAIHGTKYWSRDIGEIRLISLDTVNGHGGWQGSLDRTQFEWLKNELSSDLPRYFLLLSHHPLHSLINLYVPEGLEARVGAEELQTLLLTEPRVILWLAGHDHDNRIHFIGDEESGAGFWHVLTCSLIDWPQQGRLVEILEEAGHVVIATSMFNHQSPIDLDEAIQDLNSPINLAGISRILSANHWQRRSGEFDLTLMAGTHQDRNRYLWI